MRLAYLALLILLAPFSLSAGQLHFDFVTLERIPLVLLVQLVAMEAKTDRARVLIKKIWVDRKRPSTFFRSNSPDETADLPDPSRWSPGETRRVQIYRGVVWDDPRESPIEDHYWDYSMAAPSPGQMAFLTTFDTQTFEWVAYTTEKEAKFERYFNGSPEIRQTWVRSKSDRELVALFSDRDDRPIVIDALAARPNLSLDFIMALEDPEVKNLLLGWRFKPLTGEDREKLFSTILAKHPTTSPEAQTATLRSFDMEGELRLTTAQKMALYRFEVDSEIYRQGLVNMGYAVERELREESKEQGSLLPYALLMAVYWRVNVYSNFDLLLPLLLERLTPAERMTFYPEVLNAIITSPRRGESQPYKADLLRILLQEKDFRSKESLLWKMTEIDFKEGRDEKTFQALLEALLETGSSPSGDKAQRIRSWADPYLQSTDPYRLPDSCVDRYKSLS